MEKIVIVTQYIKVKIDESSFDEKFIKDFNEVFYTFEDIEEHIKHLGSLYARGIADNNSFIEGYGEIKGMGISFEMDDIECELMDNV